MDPLGNPLPGGFQPPYDHRAPVPPGLQWPHLMPQWGMPMVPPPGFASPAMYGGFGGWMGPQLGYFNTMVRHFSVLTF